uniref:Signal peptide-containing protein n=1 Tax=Bionectria ochroleuca TaxID=29856 RepID=A0A0B7JWN4_BIOOC
MSFPIAFQSAVFYVIACTPCAKVRHRHKVKERAKKEREEKEKIHMEQPDLYRHPSPFNTNPYWHEEMSMGPSLPKKSSSKNSSQRGLTSSGRDSEVLSVSDRTNGADSRINFGEPVHVVTSADDDDHWNRRHGYQREDEELWGQWPGHRLKDAFSKARNSAGKLIESTMGVEKEVTDQERRDFYFAPKNPPVNDYHPPVVSSKIPNRNAHQWMLQPPPSAKVMEGKIPEKLMKQTSPTEAELIESLFVTRSNRSQSLRRSRSLSLDDVDESVERPFERRQSHKIRPMTNPSSELDSDDDTIPATKPRPLSHLGYHGHAIQRPKLDTIVSTESDSSARLPRKPSRRQKPSKLKIRTRSDSPVGDDSD